MNPPTSINQIPGIWGNTLSFLGGPRACIGYRFSVIEYALILPSDTAYYLPALITIRMKAILYVLVRAFNFELAFKPEDLRYNSAFLVKPCVVDAIKEARLPISVFLNEG